MADVLAEALQDSDAAEAEYRQMREFVHSTTSAAWADGFLQNLATVYDSQRSGACRLRAAADFTSRVPEPRPLFILDYGGTLQPHVPYVSEAEPDFRVAKLLQELASVASVYVVSGRSAQVLERWFGATPIGLVSEDGAALKPLGGDWPEQTELDLSAMDSVALPMIEDFVRHTPGSKLERRRVSLVWHHRATDPKLSSLRAKELYAQLEDSLRGLPFTVLAGARAVEVRPTDMTKSSVVEQLLQSHADAGFVFCAGNDRIDEAMFEVLLRSERDTVITCFVGGKDTVGQYFVESPAELVSQLEGLVAQWRRSMATAPV
jgi:trehalose 6-phosphate synthase/phosphatase